MSTRLRVDDQPPAARLDYFQHGLASAIAPFELRLETAGPLRGASLREGRVGNVGVATVTLPPPFDCRRTPKLIRRSDPEVFKIDVQLRGDTVIDQSGRQVVMRPGDFTFVDLSRPTRVRHFGDEHEVAAVVFPHAALPLRHDELARVTAVRVPGRDSLGAPIAALARHLARRPDGFGAMEGAVLSAALIDLLSVALAERLDRVNALSRSTRRRALLASVHAFIDRQLADPGLSPRVIAASHHISVRLLHKLFAEQGTSVGRWIRDRRLERCRHDLLDPALSELPASAIAFRWGFADAAHFTRAFRKTYGRPPAEFRRLAPFT